MGSPAVMHKHLIRLFAVFAALIVSIRGETPDLRTSFASPPPDTRPGCYWYWINDNISKEGITKDLEAMARVGIGRAYIGHIFLGGDSWCPPESKVPFMSDAWWEALQWAVKEAGRCGVEIGLFNSPGWSQSGGPWVKPTESMRYLAASEIVIDGGRRIDQVLPVPEINTFPNTGGSEPKPTGPKFTEKDFQNVRVIAFQQPETEAHDIDMAQVKTSSQSPVKIGPEAQDIDFELEEAHPVQSLRLDPLDHGFTLTCTVAASDDGQDFHELARHVEERGHQGPRNKDPLLIPIPETKTKHLRVTLSATKAVSFSQLALSRRAVLAHHARKQLGEVSPSVTPPWNAYIWDSQPAIAPGSAVDSTTVVDLTDMMDADGRLAWDAPPGRWIVMRAGMVPIGTQCAPASPESRGLEVDKMNREHIRSLFDGMVGEFLRRTPPDERKAFKYVIADSYETGPQNWTDGLVEKFEERFGYSPVRFLACLNGRVIDSPELSSRFLWDLRQFIAESIATEYVGGLRDISNKHGLKLWLENYGHWGFPSEFLLYGSMSDQVGGEFWENGDPLGNVELRAAASCSHIYGRTDVYAETFTSNRSFEQTPASIKNWCDWAYGAGVNHHILHVYIHQTDERKPGITAWFGTAFNRHNTWFGPSRSFIDYTRRNTVMLKAGRPVIDVAYYIGENAPMMQGPRDPALPDGYDFDYINSDVLIHRATVKDGRILIPSGPSYAALVLPRHAAMRPEVAHAIRRLVHDGATVIGPKPITNPTLAGYPDSDHMLTDIADDLWGPVDGSEIKSRKHGKGRIHDGVDLATVLGELGIQPDVIVESGVPLLCAAAGAGKIGIREKGGIVFKHRSTPDREIYFLSNTTDHPVEFTASLRVTGRKPELWNAGSGAVVEAAAFTQRDGRTHIPLRLHGAESIYIVFGGPIAPDAAGTAATNTPEYEVTATLDGPWTVRFDGYGAPEETVFENLTDWTGHPEESIRHYAGTAVYESTFTLASYAHDKPAIISLGEVNVIATVIVNGREAGTAWTAPWEIDISDFVQAGTNTLQIRVTNSWHNRLTADAVLPPDQRHAHSSQTYGPAKKNTLQKSGLIGPVRVRQPK